MRSVFGWAEARAHDATTATERSAAGLTVLISNIDHLCARLGGDCRLGGTCRTCQGAERIRVLAYFLVRSVAL
eukprot:1589497-Prymnesium_polylepis.1